MATALGWGCADGSSGDAACPEPLEAAARAQGLIPAPALTLLPAAIVSPDPDAPDDALLVDPAPLTRGEHPGLRIARSPRSCAPTASPTAFAAPAADDAAPLPAEAALARPPGAPGRVRALLVTGEDPGAAADRSAWRDALDRLGAAGVSLHAPSRAQVESAITTLCEGAGPEDTAVLVTTGRASPIAGGALLLGAEAVSLPRLGATLAAACGGAGLRIWVLDTSYALDLSAALAGTAPLVLWRGSDPAHPDAPRVSPAGGGLLSRALAAHVATEASARCAAEGTPGPRELAAIFSGEDQVVTAMLAARWEAVGQPALDGAGLGLDDTSGARERLAAALAAGVPRDVQVAVGAAPPKGGCADQDDCRLRASFCALEPCRTLVCEAGACTPALALGAACDDGSPCTADDRCSGLGFCEGTPVLCDDGNPCTLDLCEPAAGCVSTARAADSPCDDADACTLDDRCDGAGGCVGAPLSCDDQNPCTDDRCDPIAGCLYAPGKAACDDGDPCTQQDFCEGGLCAGDPLPCDDGLPCTADGCEPGLGCVHPPLSDGLTCDDGDPCTLGDRCLSGACAGSATPCDDGLDCTLDLCQPGGCVHLPAPGTCATAAGCVPVGAHPADAPCQICAATAQLVADPALEGAACADDGIACTVDRCRAGVCAHEDLPGACHRPDGSCVAAGESLEPCLLCKGGGVAVAAPAGSPCDDGDPCTGADICGSGGACAGADQGCCDLLAEASCGADLSGDTSLEGTSDAVQDWSCLSVAPFPAPEASYHFVAPCAGTFTLHYKGLSGQLLFIRRLEDGEPLCIDGQCDTYATSTTTLALGAAEGLLLTVDGNGKVAGPFSLSIDCPCAGRLGGE
ncbi:MAG: hypothetical protein H6746_12105 [Deltaproteobacteria bacterium]|nr:hypothetical protein [Deltaproteobacteria bacterium]